MTLVDVCGTCDTMFDEGEDHCRRCGADRSEAIQREMRDMCYTYTREEPEADDIARIVKPIFFPKWGKPQWYELEGAEGPPDYGQDDDGQDDDGKDEDGKDEDGKDEEASEETGTSGK